MIELDKISSLEQLWKYIEKITKENYPDNELQPILGGGKVSYDESSGPKFMIVFINPTKRNISSNHEWLGKRYPFIGRKRPWIEFEKAGLVDDERVMNYILNNENNWSYEFTDKMCDYLASKDLFVTNIVKNTGQNADLPKADKIKLYLPSFLKEIELVDPKYIITFGLIPFGALVNEKIKLKEYHKEVVKTGKVKLYSITINNKNYKVIPCLYPIGRGNPRQAVEMLKIIKELD